MFNLYFGSGLFSVMGIFGIAVIVHYMRFGKKWPQCDPIEEKLSKRVFKVLIQKSFLSNSCLITH